VQASQQVQMSIYGSTDYGYDDGELLLGGEVTDESGNTKIYGDFRHTGGRVANNGFTPFYQHTSSATPRTCEDCHRTADTPEETTRLRGVFGYGTGEFMLTGADGVKVDGLQWFDADRNPITQWVHLQTGPVSAAVEARAMAVIVEPDAN